MAKPDTLIVDGRAFSWQQLCKLRPKRFEARKATQSELKVDCRPATERTVVGQRNGLVCQPVSAVTKSQTWSASRLAVGRSKM
jgi:hypothetical protein